ncbi:MAG: sigma-70 family RNA polymerase sigma factor [Planctomycetota bacterium]
MAIESGDIDGRDLMLRVCRGDEDAFEKLVAQFHRSVISTVYRYLGDACLAEDLAQDVFLKIYQARKRYKPLAKFETWLHRIVYNVVVNEAQSRRKRRAISLETLKVQGWEDRCFRSEDITDPAKHLQQQELFMKVRETVSSLPAPQRMALILNKYQGMSYQDIAETLNMSVEAVKSLLYRAREKVRTKLQAYLKSEATDDLEM